MVKSSQENRTLPTILSSLLRYQTRYVSTPNLRGTPLRRVASVSHSRPARDSGDIDGDHKPDILSSSAHGRGGWWFQRGNGESYTRHLIDEGSGVGTQFATEDVNGDGLTDVVTSNKKGVFLFTRER